MPSPPVFAGRLRPCSPAELSSPTPSCCSLYSLTARLARRQTGTLTEDGLDLKGVVRAPSCDDGLPHAPQQEPVSSRPVGLFTTGMSACHGLIHINGELTGDPLDLKVSEQ